MTTTYELQFMPRLSTTIRVRHGFTKTVTTIATPDETDEHLQRRHLDAVVAFCAKENSK